MQVLVINSGSSSLKCDILNPNTGERHAVGRAERVGTDACTYQVDDGDAVHLPNADHEAVLGKMLPALLSDRELAAVGHRVVHGGEKFGQPVIIDDSVEEAIEGLSVLAPLHNPANLAGIRAARALLQDIPQVAVFDTAFHTTLPRRARTYALPQQLVDKHGIRRYGFHGPSHAWVAQRAADWLEAPLDELRVITCHLGNGASVCAVEYGRSVETSMGMTPLEGLVMGTRSGDIDPGVLIDLMRTEGLDADGLDQILNRESGLAGISQVGNDFRDISSRAADGDDACRLALQLFAHRLRKYVGAYAAVMGGVDAIVFTAGIGENSALVRHRVAQRLDFLGARISEDKNRDARVTADAPVADISSERSRTKLLVVKTDEAHAIAQSAMALAAGKASVEQMLQIPVAISGRHIHLTDEAIEALFGPGHELTPYKPLSQPGQFACEEKVDIVGPKDTIPGVRILGPARSACQVEVSRTDEFRLGVDAPVRNSGDVGNSPGIKLVGPHGELTIPEGVICARRHIHMTPEDAERFGVKDRDVVEVAIDSDGRDLIFGDVLIRVKSSYRLEMHIDTDEANAAQVERGQMGVLASTSSRARLRRRRV